MKIYGLNELKGIEREIEKFVENLKNDWYFGEDYHFEYSVDAEYGITCRLGFILENQNTNTTIYYNFSQYDDGEIFHYVENWNNDTKRELKYIDDFYKYMTEIDNLEIPF